ncbi:purine and uridine phosphorylase, partial [Sarocladium strictum]
MPAQSKIRKTYQAYTVAFVFAMSFEMWAMRYMLDEEHRDLPKSDGDENSYKLGKLCGHNVVLAWLPGEQGNSQAARVATNLSRTYKNIKWRFLVGVGGGINNEKHRIRLGDVVVSMPNMAHAGVARYDLGRDTDSEFQQKGFVQPPPEYLRGIVEGMKADIRRQDSRMTEFLDAVLSPDDEDDEVAEAYKRPPENSDILFPDDVPHKAGENQSCLDRCDLTRAVAHPPRKREGEPRVWYGLIASGDSVMANTTSRAEKIRRLQADVLCFEMEAAGVMTAFPCLVIRGICDYADTHKHKEWQHYAAATAAACAKDVLS